MQVEAKGSCKGWSPFNKGRRYRKKPGALSPRQLQIRTFYLASRLKKIKLTPEFQMISQFKLLRLLYSRSLIL